MRRKLLLFVAAASVLFVAGATVGFASGSATIPGRQARARQAR
jgi:hypothetical protein